MNDLNDLDFNQLRINKLDKISSAIADVGGYPKIITFILLLIILSILIIHLVFLSMYGNIISIELKSQHEDVIEQMSINSSAQIRAIKKLHPHFLIESSIYSFKLINGELFVDDKKIETQEELEALLERKDLLKRLQNFNY